MQALLQCNAVERNDTHTHTKGLTKLYRMNTMCICLFLSVGLHFRQLLPILLVWYYVCFIDKSRIKD